MDHEVRWVKAIATPSNNELQRTSDGNAAGSPLNSVFDRPGGTDDEGTSG
jgi:hypothetical protein